MMHIFSKKNKTKKMGIERIPDAPFYYVSLQQHIGSAAEPVVEIGAAIRKYQLIGKRSNGLSANLHSPVSGIVQDIKEHLSADGRYVPMIVIRNDYHEDQINYDPIDYYKCSPEELVHAIEEFGVVGEGGAQFPTAVKYKLEGHKIHTFIVNGTECEPYLTADYALMAQRTEELFEGILIANRILEAQDIVISIEKQNKELREIFAPFLNRAEYKNIRVVVLPNEYPQGGELQLIKSITGTELPRNSRPRDIGIIVSNVATIFSIHRAIVRRKPLISRFITISGENSKVFGNFKTKIGTPINHILSSLDLLPNLNEDQLVLGGPMMGKNIADLSVPIEKGSSGILFFKKEKVERHNCISCGYCSDVCPMRLMPMKFEEYFRQGKYMSLEKYRISNCIECAACEYICPSNVPLISSIKEGKIKLKELANAIQ